MKTKVILVVMALLFGAIGIVTAKDSAPKKAAHSCCCVDCAKCCVNGCIDNCSDCSKCCPGGVCADKAAKAAVKAAGTKECKKSCCETSSKKASAVKTAPASSTTAVVKQ